VNMVLFVLAASGCRDSALLVSGSNTAKHATLAASLDPSAHFGAAAVPWAGRSGHTMAIRGAHEGASAIFAPSPRREPAPPGEGTARGCPCALVHVPWYHRRVVGRP
jgi:hypothetical protein